MVGNEFSWALGRSQAALNAKALGLFSAQGADGKPILYGSKVAFEEDQGVPPRYFLSPRRCAGIIRRAERKGKSLPWPLGQVLAATAGATPPSPSRSTRRR